MLCVRNKDPVAFEQTVAVFEESLERYMEEKENLTNKSISGELNGNNIVALIQMLGDVMKGCPSEIESVMENFFRNELQSLRSFANELFPSEELYRQQFWNLEQYFQKTYGERKERPNRLSSFTKSFNAGVVSCLEANSVKREKEINKGKAQLKIHEESVILLATIRKQGEVVLHKYCHEYEGILAGENDRGSSSKDTLSANEEVLLKNCFSWNQHLRDIAHSNDMEQDTLTPEERELLMLCGEEMQGRSEPCYSKNK